MISVGKSSCVLLYSNFEFRGSNNEDGSAYEVLARQGGDPFPHRVSQKGRPGRLKH